MSKWVDKNLFENFATEKEQEKDRSANKRSDIVWQTPEAGTEYKPKIYEGRFLPDLRGKFTKSYFYHMFQMGDKWQFVLCPKTYDFDNFCPFCSLVNKLYMGTKADKDIAPKYKRKARNVSNWFVVDDPRDSSIQDETKKSTGKVKLYEYPDKVDAKLKTEILDKKEGLREAIFDPSSEGHNFILRIKQTKKDAKGKAYPDYAESAFSRKSSALGTDAEIKKIMESRYSIEDYIKTLEIKQEDMIRILKSEMLWELVNEDANKYWSVERDSVPVSVDDSDVPDFSNEELGEEETDADIMAKLETI